MKLWLLTLALVGLTGCAHTLGYAGAHPGAMECYGKASISITGAGAIAVGYGGTELNSGTVQFDCGEKAGLKQYNPEKEPAK